MTLYHIHTIYEKGCEELGKNIESYIKSNGGKVQPSPFLLPPVVIADIPDDMVSKIQANYKVGEIRKI